MNRILFFILLLVLVTACEKKSKPLFNLLDADRTGIDFVNTITESDTFNILSEEYIYNGGGVAIADFNNDGLQDIFFSGNMVPNRLYINKGKLRFEDVTEKSGVGNAIKWNTGIAIADVNNDGLPDIYVCATMKPDSISRANTLFINTGVKDGIPVFEDQAKKYGLDEMGYSMNAAFLDYDQDGDLDLYVLNNILSNKIPSAWREKITDGTAINNDQLYRNNGNGTFTNVTIEAGILFEGYGLGISVSDYDKDGWPDIYVCNDYMSNDLLYMNNRDGTFTNKIETLMRHQSQFSMGTDAADLNNDGLTDVITLDMLPETNFRKKSTIGGTSYTVYINNKKWGYQFQHVRNMVHLNNGADKNIPFSEISFLTKFHQTDWSWSPLVVDIDNDGHRDVLITNGFPMDITDKDFSNYRKDVGAVADLSFLVDSIPVVKISNYAFKSNGDLTYKDVTKEWGLSLPSFSNGAAFADLDNDGDLDYVVNNIDDPAFVYENTLNTRKDSDHYLRLKLIGSKNNSFALGTKVEIWANGQYQYHEHELSRGYLSSVEPVIHFGIGKSKIIDSVRVLWPDSSVTKLTKVEPNQVLEVAYKKEGKVKSNKSTKSKALFQPSTAGIQYLHKENDLIDFNIQRTIPHKVSQYGPGIAVGDINGDRLEDFIVSGSANRNLQFYFQKPTGGFRLDSLSEKNKGHEDTGLALFDADNDNDLDLYVSTGSMEYAPPSPFYQDRFYLNDGKGNFTRADSRIPAEEMSGSCVRAADIDKDGDLDLFIGGRIVPGRYPQSPGSRILINTNGQFQGANEKLAPELSTFGMVSDALWTDVDSDGWVDLLVAGEFISVTLFHNESGKLVKVTNTGLEDHTGWWNSLAGADFDQDGDMDYIAGNLGENNLYSPTSEYPVRIIARDIDANGSLDAVLSCYFKSPEGEMKSYPVHFWEDMNSQSPKFRRLFSRYKQYARITMDELIPEKDRGDAIVLKATDFSNSYIENLGGLKFRITPLPKLAQIAPIYGVVTMDVNSDNFTDVVSIGNDYGNEVFSGRFDASVGLIMLGDGKGGFNPVPPGKSGFIVPGDAKALARIAYGSNDLILATQNKDSLRSFEVSPSIGSKWFTPNTDDIKVVLEFSSGKKQLIECYGGTGFFAQQSRRIKISPEVKSIIVTSQKGSRTINPATLK